MIIKDMLKFITWNIWTNINLENEWEKIKFFKNKEIMIVKTFTRGIIFESTIFRNLHKNIR